MAIIRRLTADFQAQFLAGLPTGPVWPRDPDAQLVLIIAALMPVWQRISDADIGLVADAFPATTTNLLPEWQAALGLPDPALPPPANLAAARAAVVARFTNTGGQSAAFFAAYAAALGYPISITDFAVARFGDSAFGDPMYSDSWAFVWNVVCDPAAVPVLSAELGRIKPAHTVLLFNFSE